METNSKLKVKVRALGDLIRLMGNEIIVDLKDNARLEDLISKLTLRTRAFRKGYVGPYRAGSDLIVLVNGRNVNTLKEPFPLNNGDVVTLIPPFVGG